ncbi:MAG: hypothetical protein WKG00_27615 [Polyangiaceae bacterium]
MTSFGGLVREVAPHGLLSLSDQLVLYTSHPGALFLDQTVEDALGGEGWGVRRQAAFESSHALLASVCADLGLVRPEERLDLALELFGALGHGKLTFEVNAEGGRVRGEHLHYGGSFREKYGAQPKRKRPVDAFAAGYVAAAASVAFPSDWGTFEADEVECVARGDPGCGFVLARRPERPRIGQVITRAAAETAAIGAAAEGSSGRAAMTSAGVARMLGALAADERGTVRAFGVRLALLPVSYVSQITFDTMHLVEKRSPELSPVFMTLVRESAQSSGFHLLGGVLASSEWMSEHGLPARDAETSLEQLLGVARALGWGALHTEELVPGKTMRLSCAMTHESVYYAVRHDRTVRNRLAFMQGVALALMQLLHRVDFRSERPIVGDTYAALFKSGTKWHVDETRSPLRGDDVCEVSVEALAER